MRSFDERCRMSLSRLVNMNITINEKNFFLSFLLEVANEGDVSSSRNVCLICDRIVITCARMRVSLVRVLMK